MFIFNNLDWGNAATILPHFSTITILFHTLSTFLEFFHNHALLLPMEITGCGSCGHCFTLYVYRLYYRQTYDCYLNLPFAPYASKDVLCLLGVTGVMVFSNSARYTCSSVSAMLCRALHDVTSTDSSSCFRLMV